MNNPFEILEARLSNIENILLELKQNPQKADKQSELDELLTVKDTAKFLSLSVPTVYSLTSKGELPVMKRSKRCYFLKADLINYLKLGRKKSLTETAKEADSYLKQKGTKHA